ncbi:unnamed protein product [Candidula unifasciata]|uniref:C2H2-type domain-containing protein n=1 Tax=Candidula unifasciata TaxID=100452 RepID=A0A8S3YQ12_9EUPU|nr:unnamed protein product [Candidula unifasciata]
MADKDADGAKLDISLLRTPIQISGKPIEQVLNSIHYGSPELRCLLMDECDLIFECKVCRALFRDLPNFVSHKRAYCTKSALETRHVTIAGLPEEKVVVIQPQAPEETSSGLPSISQQPKSARPSLEQTIMRIQSGELGRSEAYQVYTEAAEKLQRQKEGMKVATIRTTAIPTNKNAVFIDVNMASVNIHERQQQVNNGNNSGYDQKRNDSSVTVIKRKTGERQSNTRNVRKSAKQERQSSEPQKLLMEQLKEIQHKVKQKVAAAQDKTAQQKKVKNASQNASSQKDAVSPAITDSSQKTLSNTNTTRAQKKLADCSGLKVLSSDNVQSTAASDEEAKSNVKDESDLKEVKYALVKNKVDNKIRLKAAKENKLLTALAVTASTRRKKLSKRVPVCSKCDSVFATTKSLHYHEQIHHSGKRTFYPCPYCSSVFYYFFGITRHLFRNHSKSLDEINAMRSQLRERSFTKPLSTSSCAKEVGGSSPGSGRSTRSLGRSHLLNLSPDTSNPAETSALGDKQLYKKLSGDAGDITEAPSKIARHKIQQENSTHKEHLISPKISTLKTENAVSAKEDRGEPRPMRHKNRQQRGLGDNIRKSGKTDNLIGSPLGVSTPVSSSPIVSRSQDNLSHLCPKCHRAFRRKISCKNHIKVCKAKGGSAKKPARTPNTRHKDQGLTPDSDPFNSNKHTKMKNKNKTSGHDSTDKVIKVTSDSQSQSPVKIPEKKDERLDIFQDEYSERKTSLRNSQVSSMDRTRNLGPHRSSSVDRVVTSDEPRNRSRERNSATRDERDSSVESTQSNMEGKSPRSSRNVVSRYAALAQLSKSPSKLETSIKSDKSHESYEKVSDSQQVEVSENSSEAGRTFLHNGREKTPGDDICVETLKSEIRSKEASEEKSLSVPSTAPKTRPTTFRSDIIKSIIDQRPSAENDTKDNDEIDHEAILAEISLPSSVLTNGSPEKQQNSQYTGYKTSPEAGLSSAHQPPDSGDKSGLLSDLSSDSCRVEATENICDVSSSAGASAMEDTRADKSEAELGDPAIKSDEIKLDTVDPESTQDTSMDVMINAGEKLDTAGSEHKVTENTQSMEDVQLNVAESSRKSAEDDPDMQQNVQLDIPDYKHETSESSVEMEPAVQAQVEERLPEILQDESSIKALHLTKQEDKPLDPEKTEVTAQKLAVSEIRNNSGNSENCKNKPGSSKSKAIKQQNLPPVAVVSALSERPKRKRKVPNRNKDAEEMLSKIHNHNRDVAPVKKTKITHEIKANESPKKKLKVETAKTETSTVAVHEKNVPVKDELATPTKNRRLYKKDESLELECAVDDSDELFGKAKGRFVSNRMYVLKCGSKNKRLKCFDQTKVFRLIDEEQLKCLECGEFCSQVCNLRRHVIRQHLKWSRFKCKLCKFESYDRSECATHLIRGHKNRAITLRNVNKFILDIVRQGSLARSVKKKESTKVKQKSESREENIYVRPTVKKTLHLPQTPEDEILHRSAIEESSGNRAIKSDKEQPWVGTSVELIPMANSSESIHSVATKNQNSLLTLSPKVETQAKQLIQQHISSKAGLETAGKVTRKTLPFNISTRNSPRTFDTTPYNAVSDGAAAEAEASLFKQKFQPVIGKISIHQETVSPPGKIEAERVSGQKFQPATGKIQENNILPSRKPLQKTSARSNGSLHKDLVKSGTGFVSPALVEASSTDTVQKSRNIFEHIKLQTTSSASAVSSVVTTALTVSEPAPSGCQELTVTSSLHQNPSPRIVEVKVENPKNVTISSGQVLSQVLDSSHKKGTSPKTEKPKVVSYVFQSPQPKLSNSSGNTVNSDTLGKFLIKSGDQVSLPGTSRSPPQPVTKLNIQPGTSLSPPQPVTKLNIQPGKFTSAQVIDCANLQRKHMSVPSLSSSAAKITPADNLKVTPRVSGTSKETAASSSGLSLAAALTKGGHIFTTVATSFIVNHGQAGKFIVYTRPAGAKDSTTVSSVTKQSPVTSSLPLVSSPSVAADVQTSEANLQKDSQSQGSVVEDVLSPGTFVIRKHYL